MSRRHIGCRCPRNIGGVDDVGNGLSAVIYADDSADVLFAADNAFVVGVVHRPVVDADDAADVAAAGVAAIGHAQGIDTVHAPVL